MNQIINKQKQISWLVWWQDIYITLNSINVLLVHVFFSSLVLFLYQPFPARKSYILFTIVASNIHHPNRANVNELPLPSFNEWRISLFIWLQKYRNRGTEKVLQISIEMCSNHILNVLIFFLCIQFCLEWDK